MRTIKNARLALAEMEIDNATTFPVAVLEGRAALKAAKAADLAIEALKAAEEAFGVIRRMDVILQGLSAMEREQ